jgi:hypothetical protein
MRLKTWIKLAERAATMTSAGHREDEAAASRDAIDRDHDWHAAFAQCPKRRPVEFHDAGGEVAAERSRCFQVLTRTKTATLAGQHQRADGGIGSHVPDCISERPEQIGRHRIEGLGLVEREDSDRAVPGLLHTGHVVLPKDFIFRTVPFPARKRQCAMMAQPLTSLASILVFGQLQARAPLGGANRSQTSDASAE